jgi:phosphonate metabolism-associated iron-containing alcohol dehydrogenase
MSELQQPFLFNQFHQNWQFYNPVNVTVGRGCRQTLLDLIIKQRILIVTTKRGRTQLINDKHLSKLLSQNAVLWLDSICENPSLTDLQRDIDQLKKKSFEVIVAFGGGSTIDTAKVIKVSLTAECCAHTLQELLDSPSLHADTKPRPLYVLPTTAGTGSEVTPFATIWNREAKKKLSLAGPAVWPNAAYVDAELTDSMPHEATISTGLDAINQAAESLWNRNANPITLSYSIRALQLGLNALPVLSNFGITLKTCDLNIARDQMAEASLLAGLAISQTRTALCHSMSYPITAHFGVPHGLACAFTMPYVLRHNLQAEDGRFEQAALAITGSTDLAKLVACFDWLHEAAKVRQRVKAMVPSLQALQTIEGEMYTQGRADNNLADVTNLNTILKMAWG